jgi:hypothetical protein
MLTERERAIKGILFEEWIMMPHAGRQVHRDLIDGEFLEMELKSIKKTRRRLTWSFSLYFLFVLLQVMAAPADFGWKQAWNALFPIVMATSIALSGAMEYTYFQKRRMIYKLLKSFEGTEFP